MVTFVVYSMTCLIPTQAIPHIMNQKTALALVAIVAIAGILVVASTIVSQASAVRKVLVREKDTRSNPNTFM